MLNSRELAKKHKAADAADRKENKRGERKGLGNFSSD
jgi:hypothetical protein